MEPVLCEVCHGPGAHYHYHGLVCQSCRVFFIRSVLQQKDLMCLSQTGNCLIRPGIRPFCSSCRFKKCLAANMQAKSVGNSRRPNYVVSNFKKGEILSRIITMRQNFPKGIQIVNQLDFVKSAAEFANYLIAFSKHCTNLNGPSPSDCHCNWNVSLADLIQDPTCCSSREVAAWDVIGSQSTTTSRLYSFVNSYCRILTYFADFVSASPEMSKFHPSDRIKIVQQNFCSFGVLCIAYYKMKGSTGGKQTGRRGQRYSFTSDHDREFIMNLVLWMAEKIYPIHEIFEELEIKESEFLLLTMICLFSCVMNTSADGREQSNRAREKYSVLLGQLIREEYPHLTMEEKLLRLRRLLAIIPVVREVADSLQQIYSYMAIQNIGNLQGKLSYELHIKKYD